jgi:multiple sugar transport system permease protein
MMSITAQSPSVVKPVKQVSARKRRETKWFYIFISPWLLGFIFLSLIPLIGGFAISLSDYDGYNLDSTNFVGADNYVRAFSDEDARFALGRTLTFAAISVPLNLVFSFGIALILNRPIWARSIFRTIFYLPSIIPIVGVIWIWRYLMDTNFGLTNSVISFALPGTVVRWLTDYPTMVLVLLALWIGTGGAMIIFLAGLQGVPKELEEAAVIDGANFFQKLRSVILPLLTPVIFYQFIISIIFSLQILIEPILLGGSTAGGLLSTAPPRANYLYMVHTFTQIFSNQRFGYGSALLWLLFLLILILTILIFWTSRYWIYYETDQKGSR